MRIVSLSLTVLIFISSLQARMSMELAQQIGEVSPHEKVPCVVVMRNAYPFGKMRRTTVKNRIEAFKEIARESQEPLVSWLSSKAGDAEVKNRFWVLNGLFVKAKPAIIQEISKRPDVRCVYHNGTAKIIGYSTPTINALSREIEWGILKIEADKCWENGHTGEGVIIGIIDTGVDYLHPALEGKWAGHWFVASGLPQQEKPYDDNKHGTHCMGSILGGDGPGSFDKDIGVAPGAKYVAAKGLNGAGSASTDQLIECLQFMADLKSTVDIKAVSNSWSSSNGGEQVYWEVFNTLRSIDILPIVANGNNGSAGDGSVTSPGDYPFVIGVGATDSDDKIADFSSLGPAVEDPPYNDESIWFRDDWNYIKPNISAPGVSINSSTPNGEYSELNGTSMATPHVCGVVALLYQKNANLTHEMVYNLLLNNADQPSAGGPYPNNTFGWGRVNAWKSLQATPTMNQPWVYVIQKQMDALEPGKTVDLTITIKNLGGAKADNTTIKLISMNNYVTLQNTSHSFGTLAPKAAGDNSNSPFKISAHTLTPQGHVAEFGIILHADGEHDTLDFDDTVTFVVVIGTAPESQKIFKEDFEYENGIDSFPIIWETSGNWKRIEGDCQSQTHSLFSGNIVDGRVYCTMKQGVDLSRFKKVYLSHWTKYNFDNMFWCEAMVELSSDGGQSWNATWRSPRMSFEDSIPWTREMSDISPYLSDNVKFRVNLESKSTFQNYTNWYLDDIEVFVDTDNEPPYFEKTTFWQTTPERGPFPIQSIVTDISGIKEANLYYRVKSGTWNKLTMADQGSDVYKVEIPAQTGTGRIDYYLEATDTWFLSEANTGTDPVGSDQTVGYYSFLYGTVGIINNQQLVRFSINNKNIHNGMLNISFSLPTTMKVTLSAFDIKGRKVASLVNNKLKYGTHTFTWGKKGQAQNSVASGIYFLTFEAHPMKADNADGVYRRIEKVVFAR